MTVTLATGSTLGVLARQEIRNYLKAKLFWFGAALTVVLGILAAVGKLDSAGESSATYMIGPAALLGVLGLVTMFGLARRSDAAAEAAGAVAVPERTRTLALAAAVVVPFTVALVVFVLAVVGYYVDPPEPYTIWPGVSALFVHAEQFGDGVMCAVGGPLLGLLLARWLPRRGVSVVAAVLLVLVTILLQGWGSGGQPYRVVWVWTYFVSPSSGDRWQTAPGNPYFWVAYLAVLCVLGIVVAAYHDPESDRARLKSAAIALVVLAGVLVALTMTVGGTDVLTNPLPVPTT